MQMGKKIVNQKPPKTEIFFISVNYSRQKKKVEIEIIKIIHSLVILTHDVK